MQSFLLITFFSLLACNSPANQEVIITWQTLSDYFPAGIRNMESDSDVIGSNSRAGQASTSTAKREYGDGKYTLTMRFNADSYINSDTMLAIKSTKFTSVDNKRQTLKDAGAETMRIGLYNAVGILDNGSMTARVTVFLDNRVCVEIVVKKALALDEARIAFQYIDLDEISKLEPRRSY